MYKLLLVVCLAIGAVNGRMLSSEVRPMGIVDPVQRCGGVGTQIQLRISDCEGRCQLVPGRRYDCENNFIVSSASPSLSLKVDIIYLGVVWPILEVILQDSSVQPGIIYTARYSIVPNDILSGNAVNFRASIYHSNNRVEEVCVAAQIDIL